MVVIDSGPLTASQKFQDVPKSKWRALAAVKRDFLSVRLSHDCRCLVEFCEEAELAWKDLGYESAAEMIRLGYELDPVEIDVAVAWLKHNDPDRTISLPEVSAMAKAKQLPEMLQAGRPPSGNVCNTNNKSTDATYVCRRLLRDRPDLAEKVEAGELSAHAAAIKAGIRKDRSIYLTKSMTKLAAKLRKKLTSEECVELAKELRGG